MASGALVTSLAPRLAVFLVGRALNGVGGAAVFPVSLILIIELTSVKRRGLYIGCVNTCYTIGIACGAITAGALDAVVGWRGIFALQVPLAILMGVGVFLAIPSSTFAKRNDSTNQEPLLSRLSHIDFLGLFLLVSAIVLFLYGLSTPKITYSTIVASAFTLLAFLVVENSKNFTSQPILPLSVLRSRAVLLTCLSTLLAMVARWSILFYTPVYALSVRSFHPAQAGLILLPTNGGFALGNLLLGYFHVRRAGSFYTSCLVVYALFATSVLVLSKITTKEASMAGYFFVAGWNGFMIGASMIYTLTHVLHRTPKDSHFIISGLIAMFRGLSASFGSAIGGGIFARILKEALEKGFQEKGVPLEGKRDLIRRLLGSPALVGKLMGIEKEVAIDGYVVALRTLFATAAIVAVMATLVQAGTGWSAVQEEDGKSARLQEGDTETVIDEENVQIGAGQD
jgi:predicted MFS family arabinose efflux permease